MKTTIDIHDELLVAAKNLAHDERRSLRSVVEEALRELLAQRSENAKWTLPDRSFGGDGVHGAHVHSGWRELADETYDGRGA